MTEAVPEKVHEPRKLIWLVDTLERVTGFPPGIRKGLGFALYQAQVGQQHETAKMLRGFGETVWQVRADDLSGTYRTVYVTAIGEAVYVLHVFKRSRHLESQRPAGNWT